jgi:hypothetical protein
MYIFSKYTKLTRRKLSNAEWQSENFSSHTVFCDNFVGDLRLRVDCHLLTELQEIKTSAHKYYCSCLTVSS